MKNHIALISLVLTSIFHQAVAQSFQEQFNELTFSTDTASQRQILTKWEASNSSDPELFVAYFNYFVNKSKMEIITLGQDPKGDDVYQVMDKDTSIKEPVAYLYSDKYYEPNLLSQGFDWVNKGIEKFPNRLDMRFGKIYMFGELGDYEHFTSEIIKTIEHSSSNNCIWVWTNDKLIEDQKGTLLNTIQNYQLQLYNTENDTLLNNMKRIAEAVLKYDANHIESLSNLSIVYMLQKQYDKALKHLLKAEELNPKDDIVLSNIALAYKRKGDKKKAKKYYKLTYKYGNEETKAFAQEQLDNLKKE
jgi:tetratricopeptide (TPR) repeat protein